MVKAIAYTAEMVISGTGESVDRGSQEEAIKRFAADNNIEIIAWFADDACEEGVLNRPGIKALLTFDQPYELLICERVWAISRSMAIVESLLKELDKKGARFETATPLWDCVSQQCRRRSKSKSILPRVVQVHEGSGGRPLYRVAKPVRFNFVHLVHHASPPVSPRL